MMNRPALIGAFGKDQLRKTPPDYVSNLNIFEALYEEATALSYLLDPPEGIEVDIRLAKVLDVSTPCKDQKNIS